MPRKATTSIADAIAALPPEMRDLVLAMAKGQSEAPKAPAKALSLEEEFNAATASSGATTAALARSTAELKAMQYSQGKSGYIFAKASFPYRTMVYGCKTAAELAAKGEAKYVIVLARWDGAKADWNGSPVSPTATRADVLELLNAKLAAIGQKPAH